MNIGQLIATLGIDDSGLDEAKRSYDKFAQDVDNRTKMINKRLEESGKVMKRMGRNMSLYITAPLTLLGITATKAQMDFESSMTKITGLVGISRSQVNDWTNDILKLAPVIGKVPKELGDALYFITSAGIKGKESLDVLNSAAKASAVGLGETKVVADLVTSAMNAYGKENLSASKAVDILIASVREGKAEASELAQSMGQVLPIASAMKVSFDQVGGAVAAMTRTGTDAATASIQLRQILASLLKPASQAEEALGAMGTSSEELRRIIQEKGLITGLSEINKLTSIYGEELMARVFPNIRALSGVLDLMGSNMADNVAIFESLKDATGSLDNAWKEYTETSEYLYKKAIAGVKTSLVELGVAMRGDVAKILIGFTERIGKLSDWFSNLSESQRGWVIRIAAVTAALGPLLTALGFLVGNVLPSLVKTVGFAVKAFKALRLVMITNPMTAMITTAVSLIAVLVSLWRKTKQVTEQQEEYNTALEETERIANRKKILQFLRDMGILQKELKEISPDIFVESEKIVATAEAFEKLGASISKMSISQLKGLRDILSTEIVEIKRGLQGVDLSGVLFGDIAKRATELTTLQNSLELINKELERASKIDPLEGFGANVDKIEEIKQIQGVYFEGLKSQIVETDQLRFHSAEYEEDLAQRMFDFKMDLLQAEYDRKRQINDMISSSALTLTNFTSSLYDRELELVERRFDSEIEIRKQAGKSTEELEKQKAEALIKIERQKAIMERTAALFQIVLDTIQAVNEISMTAAILAANPLTAPLAVNAEIQKGIAIATGALNAASVLAQPLPSFAKGGKVPPGYPNDSYPAWLTSGEVVTPAQKVPDLEGGRMGDKKDIDRLIQTIQDKPVLELNWDKDGIGVVVKDTYSRNEYINRKFNRAV